MRGLFLELLFGNLLVVGVAVGAAGVMAYRLVPADALEGALVGAAVAGAAAAALLALAIARTWSVRLRRVARAAGQNAGGDLASRVGVSGRDELAQLSAAVGDMRRSLLEQVAAAEARRRDLQTVIAGLADGVIALDGDQRITLMNQAAMTLLAQGMDDPVGKHIQAVVRQPELQDLCDRASPGGGWLTRQIELEGPGGRTILDLNVTKMEPHAGQTVWALLVARDVTQLARTAAVKAEFVANASHELRTPLATLRAAVESLASADPADREDFDKMLGVLQRNVQRLENLTRDLLDLHVVESGRLKLAAQDIPLDQLERWARDHFAAAAAEKGVVLEVAVSGPAGALKSDRKLIEIILANLIDNAIKFTPAGGKVSCVFAPGAGSLSIRVADTGCGIRKEDQGRVFERFFQADAARSGDAARRGTGLGLAIVKHAAERLGAKVTIKSELGRGTTVSLSLPSLG